MRAARLTPRGFEPRTPAYTRCYYLPLLHEPVIIWGTRLAEWGAPDVRAHVGTRRYRLAGAGRRVTADGVLVFPVSARRARRSDLVLAPVYWW